MHPRGVVSVGQGHRLLEMYEIERNVPLPEAPSTARELEMVLASHEISLSMHFPIKKSSGRLTNGSVAHCCDL